MCITCKQQNVMNNGGELAKVYKLWQMTLVLWTTVVYHLLQVLQNILETEHEYSKELQSMLSTYLRPLQTSEK